MMTALYRRYRPDTFEEVIGQDHVTKALQASLANGRINHAYLFSGPRGCGKTTSARILARCLNCAEGPTPTPCGKCDSCRDLGTGGPGSIDVVEIDSASHNGVDDARELRERATFAPARDRFKIFILDEAHMVTPQGFNALLKLVEEPPPHIKFIFATTDPDKVIGTIRSRTHHYPFRLVAPEVLRDYLADLCEKEGVEVEDGVLGLAVRAGGGSVRDSLSILDQLIAGETEPVLHYERAVALLGYTDSGLLSGLVDGLIAGSGADAYGVVDRMIQTGHEPRRFVEDLLQYLRNLVIMRLAGADSDTVLGDVPAAELEKMHAQVSARPPRTWTRAAELVNGGLTEMGGASSPRLSLELLVAKLLLDFGAGAGESLDGAVGRGQSALRVAEPESPQAAPTQPVREPVKKQREERGSGLRSEPTSEPVSEPPANLNSNLSAEKNPESATAMVRPKPEPMEEEWKFEPTPWNLSGESVVQKSAVAQPGEKPRGSDYEAIRSRWGEIMERLQERHSATASLLSEHGQLQGMREGSIEIAFQNQGMLRAFGQRHTSALADVIAAVTGIKVSVQGVVAGFGAPQSPAPSVESPRYGEDFAKEQTQNDSEAEVPDSGVQDKEIPNPDSETNSIDATDATKRRTSPPNSERDSQVNVESQAGVEPQAIAEPRDSMEPWESVSAGLKTSPPESGTEETPGIEMAQAVLGGTIIDPNRPDSGFGTGANRS